MIDVDFRLLLDQDKEFYEFVSKLSMAILLMIPRDELSAILSLMHGFYDNGVDVQAAAKIMRSARP